MSENDQPQTTAREAEGREEDSRPQSDRAGDRGQQRLGRSGGGGERRGRGGRRHGQQHSQQSSPQQQQRRPAEPSLNMEELRELAELFSSHGLTDFEFENEEIRVRLSRSHAPQAAPAPAPATFAPPVSTAAPATTAGSESSGGAGAATSGAGAESATAAEEELHIITSPIVGTFYRSPAPNAEVFVRAGSHVEPDTVVCIIEAMKLMNEIQAETSGTVEKIYVENGQPVEFGQPLFGVKK